jgi:hypothetical protein
MFDLLQWASSKSCMVWHPRHALKEKHHAACLKAISYAQVMPDPKPNDVDFHEETDSPTRNFYKVEKWTRDGTKVDSLHYAGNSFVMARSVFERAIKHRPRIRLTLPRRIAVNFAKLPELLQRRKKWGSR